MKTSVVNLSSFIMDMACVARFSMRYGLCIPTKLIHVTIGCGFRRVGDQADKSRKAFTRVAIWERLRVTSPLRRLPVLLSTNSTQSVAVETRAPLVPPRMSRAEMSGHKIFSPKGISSNSELYVLAGMVAGMGVGPFSPRGLVIGDGVAVSFIASSR